MSNKKRNTLMSAITSYIKIRLSIKPKESKVEKTKNVNKGLFAKKENTLKTKDNKKLVFKGVQNYFKETDSFPKLFSLNHIHVLAAFSCVVISIVTMGATFGIILNDDPNTNGYTVFEQNTPSSTFAAITASTNNNNSQYNGDLVDGDQTYIFTTNFQASNTGNNDLFLARKKQEQYDFLKSNYDDNMLALIINRNSGQLFKDYTSSQISLAIDNIVNYLYQDLFNVFLASNSTSFINYFQGLGFEGRSQYRDRVLKPRAYIYFYLMTRMATTASSDSVNGNFSMENVFNNFPYMNLWGIKIAKNYTAYASTNNIFCQGVNAISETNLPDSLLWNKLTNCNYLNGDIVLANNSPKIDSSNNQIYNGYIGTMGGTENDWYKFCDFVSAQRCIDAAYDSSVSSLEEIAQLFSSVSKTPTSGFYKGNLFDIGLSETGSLDDPSVALLPFENFYMLFRREVINKVDVIDANDKFDLTNRKTIDATASFLNSTFKTTSFYNFCVTSINKDFTFQAQRSADTNDVDLLVYDQYTQKLFVNLCTNGISY